MKKFQFSLEKLMEYRKSVEQQAQRDFFEIQSKFIEAQNKLEDLKSILHDSFLLRSQLEVQGGSETNKLEQIYFFQKGQAVRIASQTKIIAVFEKEVEAKREILRQKAIDYKIITKLKEKKREEYLAEYIKEEDGFIDEQNILRFKTSSKNELDEK
ncbi:MAG: flagellar export protein FliJ [Pseudobdellovibrionaceae bacterium]